MDKQTRLRELADECEAVAKERAQEEGGGLHYMNTCDWSYAIAFRGAANEIDRLSGEVARRDAALIGAVSLLRQHNVPWPPTDSASTNEEKI